MLRQTILALVSTLLLLFSITAAEAAEAAAAAAEADAAASSSSSSSSWADEFVVEHNKVRADVKEASPALQPLRWNASIAAAASAAVAKLRQSAGTCPSGHSGSQMYGENTFWTSAPGVPAPAQVVASWSAQRRFYDYGNNTCLHAQPCGVFTQIVWNTTSFLGCASAACAHSADVLVLCNYYPPGNYVGQRPF